MEGSIKNWTARAAELISDGCSHAESFHVQVSQVT